MGSAASPAYSLGKETASSPSVGAGLGGVARAAGNAVRSRMSGALGLKEAAASGRQSAWDALNQHSPSPSSGGRGGVGEPGGPHALARAVGDRTTPPHPPPHPHPPHHQSN